MAASMTNELKRRMRSRPFIERIRLWYLLRLLNHLDRIYQESFVGDAGFGLSDYMNGGQCSRILARIERIEGRISKITRPVMESD